MSIFLIVALFIAIPICEKNSGKQLSRILIPNVGEDTQVISFRKGYSGSLVFYSGLEILRMEMPEDLAKVAPHEMQWSSLNVMPIITPADLPDKGSIIAVVSGEKRNKIFLDNVPGTWILIDTFEDSKIYRRISRKEVVSNE